jgi:tRNA(Ile)-lysidine synthase
VALLLLAARWAKRAGRPLLALTVDHGLQQDSAAWTARAGEQARAAGADWRALAWTGPKPATGLPAAARAARHRLLAAAARTAGAQVLLTGHTLDDVLEGEAMRAETPTLGALREWSPSPAWPEGRGLFLLRPLIGLRRPVLRDWLSARGADWFEDPANADPLFARTRARAAVSAGTGSGAPDAEAPRPPAAAEVTSDGRIRASRAAIAGEGGRRLLAAAVVCAAGGDHPPRGDRVAGLQARLSGKAGGASSLGGARICTQGALVELGREAGEGRRGRLESVVLEPGQPAAWDGRYEIEAEAPGWTVTALDGRMAALSRQDRARLKALPPAARRALPAMVDAAGTVRLPRPFGDGPARAWSLTGWRLAGACGLMARESEIGDPRDGARDLLTLSSTQLR